jgi:hypothetical protein
MPGNKADGAVMVLQARRTRHRRQSNDWQMRRRSFASKGSRAGEAERTSEAKWTQGIMQNQSLLQN